MTGDPRFHKLLEEIGQLHDKKQEDYGSDTDPFANVRSSEDWGIEPWVGALVRLNDKVHRLQQFALKGELANESAEDSMMDITVYGLIALILYREAAENIPRGTEFAGYWHGVPTYVDHDAQGETIRPTWLAPPHEDDERDPDGYPVGTPTDQAEHESAAGVRLVRCNCTSGPCHEPA